MTVLLICNTGAGFAQNIEVTDGITVSELFKRQCPNGKPADYLIRVNRLPCEAQQILQANDRISFTPKNVSGASV